MADPSTLEPGNRDSSLSGVQIYVFHHDPALLQRALKKRTPESFCPQFAFIDLNALPLPAEAVIAGVEPSLNRAMLSEYLGILSVEPPETVAMVGTFTYSVALKFSLAWAHETGNNQLFLPEVDFAAIEALAPQFTPEYLYGVEFKHPLADDRGPVQQLAKQRGGAPPQARGPYKGSLICSRERFLALQAYLRQALPTILSFEEEQLGGVINPFSAGAVADRAPERAELDRRRSTYGNALERAMALFFSGEQERRLQIRLGDLVRGLQVSRCPLLQEAHRAAFAGTVVLTFCNEAYLPVLRRWLEQARQADIRGLLVVSFDAATRQFCREQEIATADAEIPFPQDLAELWRYRLELTRRILHTSLSVLLSDIDAYWLANPMPRLQAGEAHIVASQGTYYPRDVYEQTGIVLCCGFMYYRYGAATLLCLEELCQAAASDGDDQRVLNRWLLQQGIQWRIPRELGRTSLPVPGSELAFTAYDDDLEGETRGGLRLRLLAHPAFQRVLDTSTRPIVSHLYVPKDSGAKLEAHALLEHYPPDQPEVQRQTQPLAVQECPPAPPSTLIWLASYPRSGNTMLRTWLKSCLNLKSCSVYNDSNDIGRDPAMRALTGHYEREWFYGRTGNFMLLKPQDYIGFNQDRNRSSSTSPVKTHGLWNHGYQNDPAIYILRDGRSALASHAHYRLAFAGNASENADKSESSRRPVRAELEEMIICGRPQCGYWSDNVCSWLNQAQKHQYLIIKFEDAIIDPHHWLKRIGGHLKRPLLNPRTLTFKHLNSTESSFFRSGNKEAPEFKDKLLSSLFFAFEWPGMLKAGYISEYTYPWQTSTPADKREQASDKASGEPDETLKSIKYIRTNITRYGASTHQLNLAAFQEKLEDVSDRCLRYLTTSGMDSSQAKDEAETWKQLQAEWHPNSRPKQFFSEKQREINSGMRANEDVSIFFYTLHKCGSTLIERRVLGRSPLYRHVDYASELYSGRRTETEAETITFEKHGCIYGPIRISAREGPVARLLVAPTTTKDFLSDRKAIFMVRDPRDIIVSSYYSFGYSHPISQQPEIAENQSRARSRIQEVSIDEYARGARLIANHRDNFLKIEKLASACPNCTVIRYDDMIDDFDKFAAQLTELLPLSSSILDQLREESRPSTQESVGSHKRSGAPGGFRTKLNEETISILNEELGDILDSFGYHP